MNVVHVVMEGMVVVAVGDKYCDMAFTLALSRGTRQDKLPITLLGIKGRTKEEYPKAVFHNIVLADPEQFPELSNADDFVAAMYLKLLAYRLSPYYCTILLDADTLFLPGENPSLRLMENLKKHNSDFLAYNNGYYDFKAPTESNSRYTFWCDPIAAGIHYGIITGIMPQINASLLFFCKEGAIEELFNKALEVWDDQTFTSYRAWHGSRTEEMCLNIACAICGIAPFPETRKDGVFKPIFIQMHTESWPAVEFLQENFFAISMAGAKKTDESIDDRLVEHYNRLSLYFYYRFGVDDYNPNIVSKGAIDFSRAKVVMFWHVALMNNWREVVCEQSNYLMLGGLADRITEIHVCSVGGSGALFTELQNMVLEIMPDHHIVFKHVSYDLSLYEFPTLAYLQKYCKTSKEAFVGLYIHTKGVSKPHAPAKKYWRKYLQHYTLMLWERNFEAIASRVYDVAGANWKLAKDNYTDHFSGNFWWFNSNYIKNLPLVSTLKHNNRYAAEMWVGSGKPRVFCISDKVVNDETQEWYPKKPIVVIIEATAPGSLLLAELTYKHLFEAGIVDEAKLIIVATTKENLDTRDVNGITGPMWCRINVVVSTDITVSTDMQAVAVSLDKMGKLMLGIPANYLIVKAGVTEHTPAIKKWNDCLSWLEDGFSNVPLQSKEAVWTLGLDGVGYYFKNNY